MKFWQDSKCRRSKTFRWKIFVFWKKISFSTSYIYIYICITYYQYVCILWFFPQCRDVFLRISKIYWTHMVKIIELRVFSSTKPISDQRSNNVVDISTWFFKECSILGRRAYIFNCFKLKTHRFLCYIAFHVASTILRRNYVLYSMSLKYITLHIVSYDT